MLARKKCSMKSPSFLLAPTLPVPPLSAFDALLKASGEDHKVDIAEFRRYGSARKLYNFNIDNAGAY